MIGFASRYLAYCLAVLVLVLGGMTNEGSAHGFRDGVPRTAIVSAFAPEMLIMKSNLADTTIHEISGIEFLTGKLRGHDVVLFLSGISVVNAAMSTQAALDNFSVQQIVFSGIAGGVDPELNIGDVVIADRWGQYLELLMARQVGDGWQTMPFFEYPYQNFGMMFPRSVTVQRVGAAEPETRFWFSADDALLTAAREVATSVSLENCTAEDICLDHAPTIVVGGSGVSGSAFVDNAAFRAYVFRTYGARVLDMESAPVGHVAWANGIPFLAVRSVADLAGGSASANQMEVFLGLAAGNATAVVLAILDAVEE